VVHPSVPANTVAEFIAYAKANPGKIAYASSGPGSTNHLCAAMLERMAGIEMLHVPYKGTGQAVTDLLGGQINVMFGPAETVMPHVKSGRLRALAVTSAERFAVLPDLPTVAESGVPGYSAVGWFGLFAPAGTPRALVARISADANQVLRDPEVKKAMVAAGAEASPDTPEEFGRFVHSEMDKWTKLMNERGIVPQ